MHIFEISSRKRKIPFDLLIFSVQEKQKKQRWKKNIQQPHNQQGMQRASLKNDTRTQ